VFSIWPLMLALKSITLPEWWATVGIGGLLSSILGL
jgi:hypothetical protein